MNLHLRTRPRARLAVPLLLAVAVTALVAGCKGQVDNRPPEQIWNEVCATCHGANGAGMRHKLGKHIDMRSPKWQSSLSDEEIATTIDQGKRGNKLMPAFGARFSDQQIEGLVEYLRTEIASTPR